MEPAPSTKSRREESCALQGKVICLTEADFPAWYAAYPRHVGRGAALKAYRAARKKVDAAALLSAAERFAGKSVGSDPKFIPHPATWLNGERWADADHATPSAAADKPQSLAERVGITPLGF